MICTRDLEIVAECLDKQNEGLFRRNGCERIVFTGEIVPLIMAKTAIDRGVGPSVFETLDTRTESTLYSIQDAQLDGYTSLKSPNVWWNWRSECCRRE